MFYTGVLWHLFNWLIMGDALFFLRGTYLHPVHDGALLSIPLTTRLSDAVAGAITNRLDRSCEGRLLGGNLKLEWSSQTNHVLMTGPATEVFVGEWPG